MNNLCRPSTWLLISLVMGVLAVGTVVDWADARPPAHIEQGFGPGGGGEGNPDDPTFVRPSLWESVRALPWGLYFDGFARGFSGATFTFRGWVVS